MGSGGMGTKLEAIHRVNKLGVSGQIVNGSLPASFSFCVCKWLVRFDAMKADERSDIGLPMQKGTGRVSVDRGQKVLRHQGSLLPIGVTEIFGDFPRAT